MHKPHVFRLQREYISIHVSQAGQIGNACWELYCLEQGFDQTVNFYKQCSLDRWKDRSEAQGNSK